MAVAVAAALSETVHPVVPVQAPLHPAKVKLAAGVAVNVTWVPEAKLAVQVVDDQGNELMMPDKKGKMKKLQIYARNGYASPKPTSGN